MIQAPIITAPPPPNEDARLAALCEYHILDTGPDDACDDITHLAASICGTPIAAVTLIDAKRQWFKSAPGIDSRETSRKVSCCAPAILHPDLLIVPDTTNDACFADNPPVTGAPHIRFYAGVPLVTEGEYALGALCVIDRKPRLLTPRQEHLMAQRQQADAARHVLEGVVASTVEGIVIADARQPDMPITCTNPTFLELTGYAEREVLGRNCRFFAGHGQ